VVDTRRRALVAPHRECTESWEFEGDKRRFFMLSYGSALSFARTSLPS
jgi:hypothetical protein